MLISIVERVPSKEAITALEQYCSYIIYFKTKRTFSVLNGLRFWIKGLPAQVGYFFRSSIKRQIYQSIVEFQPDRIYCQLIRVSEYVKALPYVKVLDYMDTFSAGMERQARQHMFPIKIFYSRESKLIRAYERSVYAYFDLTTIISERDRNELPLLSKNLVHVVPNGIDTEYFTPDDRQKDADILFVGNLGYKPNEQAVLTLLEWYRGCQWKVRPKVIIAGARPTQAIQNLSEPDWQLLGWVDDIRDAYRRAKLFVAPLTTGSGLQNKLLEAMSSELVCITTDLVNDSIKANDRENILIANDRHEFQKHVENYLKDHEKRTELAKQARNFVVKNYQWGTFNAQLDEVIRNAKSKSEIGGDLIS